ncbi:MAG TPA: hypothetical protein VFV99_02305 [Kofleriaceae bacterium]|nr:hypothetical protein [Kofleriaceae bacterium]
MRTAIVALVTAIALFTTVVAGPRKVIVLPLDGNASVAQKTQLNDSVAKIAKEKIAGDVTRGDTTFAETAAAVGCDPANPACADTVRSTLAVDELVYGTAKTSDGKTTVTVYWASKGSPTTSRVAIISETDTGDKAEPALTTAFDTSVPTGSDVIVGSGSELGSGSGSETPERIPGKSFFDSRDRKLGVGLAAGGVIAIVIGLSLWSSKSDLQDQIDNHPTRTLVDLQDLHSLEDRASSKALWGNILVGLGLGLGATGAYFLYRDHESRNTTVTPAPVEAGTGMTLVLGGRW